MTTEALDDTDQICIGHLLNLYHAAVNYRDWSLVPQIFAAQAVWSAAEPLNLRFEGLDAIAAFMNASVSRQAFLAQSSSAVLIRSVSPERANIRSTLTEFGKDMEGVSWTAFLDVRDVAEKGDKGWRLITRHVTLKHSL